MFHSLSDKSTVIQPHKLLMKLDEDWCSYRRVKHMHLELIQALPAMLKLQQMHGICTHSDPTQRNEAKLLAALMSVQR